MKFRNKFVSKRIGTKTLASLLAFGMALGSPMAVFADDGETAVVAENTVQAKKTDGSEVFVSVSDYVRGMMERGAVRLNDETGYLEDTSTGQKVDPETGERLTETPDVPETGDSSSMALYLVLMGIAAMSGALVLRRKNK